ncbi:hypothetical protein FOS14_17615 [Skermania sp. ID1734]|uniref:hypothetical protein n=1 Tax=Skermania sp. ID1734 TaxID=2597516 RepID=UPI00117D8F90|nr:hypothetical protein [Skermania sp. ID1734]TSD95622.1 hypothetical protein FOS14_17615 [Skermania sp. ID1734]
MLEPNGPLPPEVYRRRRVAAIVIAVVVLVVLVWIIASMRGGDDSSSAAAAASSSAAAASSTAASATAGASGAPAPGQPAASGVAAPSGQAAAPVPAGQCPDQSLALKATVGQPTYPAGQKPQFGMVITNISTAPCQRDLGAGLQQMLVYSIDGTQRIWSNTDCFPSNTPDVRTLNPGQQAVFKVEWSGETSQPQCAGDRVPVQPGAYTVVAQLGALRSPPEPFNIS